MSTPFTQYALYVWSPGINQWVPWNGGTSSSSSTTGNIPKTYTPLALYYFDPKQSQWLPWEGGFSAGVTPAGPAGGDLSGTYPNPTVKQINGAVLPVSSTYVGTNPAGQIISSSLPTATSSTLGIVKPDNTTISIDPSGVLSVLNAGSPVYAYKEVSSTYSITTADFQINGTSGTFTITLPTAVGIPGKSFSVKNTGTGVITVATTSSQTIDGQSVQTLSQWTNMVVMSTGANWIIR